MTREEQVAHIERHREAFREHQCYLPPFGDTGDVSGYFADHSDPELYWNLCNDLGIEPLEPFSQAESG